MKNAVVNEDITPEVGTRTVVVETATKANEPVGFWGYATDHTITPYQVYLENSITEEDEIDVISRLLTKEGAGRYTYSFSEHPELDMLRAMKNPDEWELQELAKLELQYQADEPLKITSFWHNFFVYLSKKFNLK